MLVLCYHAVSDTWPAELSVTSEAMTRQLAYLATSGYVGVTFSDVVLGRARGRSVAVTFDDGYESVATLAAPILARFEMPGTVFVPTRYIGGGPMSWDGIDRWTGSEHERELVPITWEQASELAAAGWEIGAHTSSHPRLTEVSDEELESELTESRRVCEEMLGRPCRSMAYPYGDYDDRVIAAALRAGYTAAATLPARHPRVQRLAWPRVGVYHADSLSIFRLKVSPAMRRLRRTPLWTVAVEPARDVARARRTRSS